MSIHSAALKYIEAYGDPHFNAHPSAKFNLHDPDLVLSECGSRDTQSDDICEQLEGNVFLRREMSDEHYDNCETDVVKLIDGMESFEDIPNQIDDFSDSPPSFEQLMQLQFNEIPMKVQKTTTPMEETFLNKLGLQLPSSKFRSKPSVADEEMKQVMRESLRPTGSFTDGQRLERDHIPTVILNAMKSFSINPMSSEFREEFEKDSEDLSDFDDI